MARQTKSSKNVTSATITPNRPNGHGHQDRTNAINWTVSGDSLAAKFGMDERSIEIRRQFIRLGDEDRTILSEMVPWIQSVAHEIAADFYDWQFEFGPTCEFFNNFAIQSGMPVAALREHLEKKQANYLIEVFAGSAIGWDLRYAEKRLQIQTVHDRIELPFKWFVGSYAQIARLIDNYLRRDLDDEDKVRRIESSVDKVFNLDMQIVADACILNSLESTLKTTGMTLSDASAIGDKSEQVEQIKRGIGVQMDAFTQAMKHMSASHDAGDIDVVMPVESLKGTFQTIAKGVNDMVAGHIKVKKSAMACVAEFGKGNFEAPLEQFPGKKAFINETIEAVRANLKALIVDTDMLIEAAVQGQLSARADVQRHSGDFAKIVGGMNRTLDAVIQPLKVAADYVNHISKGEVPPKISDTYYGDFNEIKESLNNCIDCLGGLIQADAVLTRMAVNDYSLQVEGDFQGIFASVATAVNHVRTRILHIKKTWVDVANGDLSELPEYKKIGRRSDGDELIPAIISAMESINSLSNELKRLTTASREGQLSERGKPEMFEGAYADIVSGINEMLDAILLPIGEGNRILRLIRGGNLTERVEIACKGDHEKMKEAVNGVHTWLKQLVDYVTKIANGDMNAEMAKASNEDQIHDWLMLLKSNITQLINDAGMLEQAAADGKLSVRADASKHHGGYRKIIEGVNQTLDAIAAPVKTTAESASTLASSSEELTAVSQSMASSAEETAAQANAVSAASEQVSKNVSSVAAASEQMQASIREISKNANDSARVAKNAVAVAETTNVTMKKLGTSSREIGNVIKVINSIAQQTNLLALNATIEAARAGEAGKGFAVVANEVKELAKQTAKATDEIGQKIEATQNDTKGAVAAIEEITGIIDQINDISNSIASAVEEQTVTTNEISRSVAEAALGVNEIAKNVQGVAESARNTTQGATDTMTASQELSEMAARLQASVSRFTF